MQAKAAKAGRTFSTSSMYMTEGANALATLNTCDIMLLPVSCLTVC